jgi:hypothetical protein
MKKQNPRPAKRWPIITNVQSVSSGTHQHEQARSKFNTEAEWCGRQAYPEFHVAFDQTPEASKEHGKEPPQGRLDPCSQAAQVVRFS